MFLQELLKPLQSPDEGSLNTAQKANDSNNTLSSFGIETVAKAIAARGGLGIADHVIRQINLEQQKSVKHHPKTIHKETDHGTKVS
jgi:Rod binding domain-containing protein